MSEPIPIHVKWYETTMFFDETKGVSYSRSSLDPVILIRNGGIFSLLGDTCESWKINWNRENKDTKYGYSFELTARVSLQSPLNVQVPVLNISDTWVQHGVTFDLSRRLKNRVNQLLRFVQMRDLLVPNGTLFLMTRTGIHEALEYNEPRSFVIGYSGVEPTPVGNYTPLTLSPPEMWLPNFLKPIRPSTPVRVSRYARPWVI